VQSIKRTAFDSSVIIKKKKKKHCVHKAAPTMAQQTHSTTQLVTGQGAGFASGCGELFCALLAFGTGR
jgi:hypothetical protein